MFLRKLPLTLLWGCFFYFIFLIQALLIYFVDMSSIGIIGKWRFESPTSLTFIYLVFSLIGFLVCHIFILQAQQKFSSSVSTFYFYNLSFLTKFTYIINLFAYIILSLSIFSDNYRKDSNAISMMIMTPLHTFLWSFILIFIFLSKEKKQKYISYLMLGLVGLFANITGVGSFTILIAITLIYISINTNLGFKALFFYIFFGNIAIFSILLFTLTWKYGFEISELNIDVIITLIEWIIQRLSTVPGATIFLIENYFSEIYHFNIFSSYEIFLRNFYKIVNIGFYESEYASLGEYTYSLFYSGNGIEHAGLSPGLLGGALFFFPWPLAAVFSGLILYLILYLISVTWGYYITETNLVIKFLFFYFIINYLLLNPYAWFSVLDPGLIKFLIFLLAPKIFQFLNRIKVSL